MAGVPHAGYTPAMDAQDVTRKHPIVAAFARRPVTLTVLVLATLLTGAIAQSRIRLEMMPTGLDVRGLSVTIPLRAQRTVLSPQEIEKRITLIAEGELSTIPGIESLISVSTRSEARFEIAFRGDSDLGIAYDQVRDRIERARTKIGADIGAVRYRQWTYGSESIANVSISWDEQVENPFDKLAQQIVPALEAAGGISHVTMNGDLQPYYRIALKRDAIATHPQIHLNRLLDALQADNTTTAVGKIHSGEQDTSIIADARFRSLDDIRAFPVTDNISLGDIADVSEAYNVGGYAYTYQRGTGESVYDGGRSVWTQVYKTSSANIVEAGQAFETKLEELRADPSLAGFTYRVGRNDGTEVVTQLNTLFTSLLLGGVLAVLCLLAFIKSIRLALVIALAIPLSMTMALVVMYFAGETINLLTLMGFTVAGGMLLDNAIVVSENIFRRIPADREPYIASVRGAGEVGMALALATSTTVAVLLSFVVFSKSPEMSFFMTRLAWPIWLSLGFSVIVALLVVPHATSRLFAKGHESASRQRYERLSHRLLSASGTKRFAGTLLSVFFGRPEGMASRDGMGDAVDRFLARRGASQLCWLTLAAIGIGAGVWAFVAAGGDHESISEVWKRIVKGFGGSAGRGDWRRGRGGDDDEGDPFPALIALGVFAGILLIPPLVVRLLPRRDDQSSATPLLSRLQRIYGAMIARACVHPMRAAMIVALAMAALVFTGVSLIKTTESNPGNQKSLSFRVHFPTPIDLKLDPQGTGFEGKTGMPREWAYFLDLRRIFLGIDPDGSTDQRAQQAAWERFGIERGTLNLSSSSIRLWLTLDSSRIDEAKELEDAIREAFPETPGLRLSGGASGRSTIRVQLRGKEFSRLKELSGEVIRALSRLRGLESVEEDMESSPFQELVLAVDEKRAAAMGVRP
ncbi:MAG: efflux RND transporter permease subunit, partial [Planctomycetes bacterium]|nr:efflux RND transporter permease subunit [Planctomycetota bacterium]